MMTWRLSRSEDGTAWILLLSLPLLMSPLPAAGDGLTLEVALRSALESHPALGAAKAKVAAERAAVSPNYWPEDPRFGLMHEENLTLMETQNGPMNTFSLSQEFQFPAKSYFLGSGQKSRADRADADYQQKNWEIRSRVVGAYFDLYVANRVLNLLQAQRETLREIARAAESRHTTGVASQQEEMKAHLEQTQIEKELLQLEEERATAEAALYALLPMEKMQNLVLPEEEFAPPELKVAFDKLAELVSHHSYVVRGAEAEVAGAQAIRKLSYWELAPDFEVNYLQAYGDSAPSGAYAIGAELTFPLWFLGKERKQIEAARASELQATNSFQEVQRETLAAAKSLLAKVQSAGKILRLFQSGFIPQATATLNSSFAAYRASRATLLDLLDSERTLYQIRTDYYRTLAQYVLNVARLEETVGTALSDLPGGGTI